MPNKKLISIFIFWGFFTSCWVFAQTAGNSSQNNNINPNTTLWYKVPAGKWDEALPVGNGRLGAMVYGKKGEEQIQFNEETYWTGGPYSTVVKGGYKFLPEIQKLVFEGKYLDAHNLFGRKLMGYPVEQQKYQNMANLHLFFKYQKEIIDYKRWLDLETGITGVEYTANGITFRREVFSSSPDQVIVIRLTASKPGSISFTANLRGVRNQSHSNYATDYFRMDPAEKDGLRVTGKSADYMGIAGKLRYEARLKAIPEGGSIRTEGADLIVENADAVTICFVAATNFINYKDVSADEKERIKNYLKNISRKNYNDLESTAVSDYKKLFDRASLSLASTDNSYLPTDERMKKIQSSPDPSLAALCYNFGRYVLISSSRPGTQPANLQGIWNNDMNPSWDSKYTTNINTEMNYWPVESGNLHECAEPLIKMIKELTHQGNEVARQHYDANGWVFHQNTDLWRVAAPMDGPTWGTFTVGGAWLCTHLWEHYIYTMDRKFLEEVYPVLEGSVQFFMNFLVEHPNGKWLVTNPSTSPENFPDGGGNKPYFDEVTGSFLPGTTICAGSSIDMQIIYDLFGYYLKASDVLKKDSPFNREVKAARSRLAPPQIGSDGSLQEWADDWKSLEKNHRHFSHLYGLYPGLILTEKKEPEFIEAYKKVLNERGDGAAGWSRGWKMALWARLLDGNRANKIFKLCLLEQTCIQLFSICSKSMQIDGTLGVAAGITEMLMQSHEGYINLLPALPDEWNSGHFKGVCTRGAFELDYKWDNKKLTQVEILSKAGEICRIKVNLNVKIISNNRDMKFKKISNGVIEFPTEKGVKYFIEIDRI